MDNPAPQPDSDKQRSSIFLAALQILDRIENWLACVFELTEEELENAGVHLNDQSHK